MLARLDALWTRVELALCAFAGAALVLSLSAWVVLKGLAQPSVSFRAALGAVVLGIAAALLTRKRSVAVRRGAVAFGLALGIVAAWAWKDLGVSYFANLLGWLQDGSTLTLTGGLRGLGTRLTLWLALLGGSLATASGRHVTIDVVSRSLGTRARLPLSVLGGLLAAVVCFSAAWGFADFIARDGFEGNGEVAGPLARGVAREAFVVRRQLALDLTVAGRILKGQRWDSTLTAAEWNGWLAAGDWATQFERPVLPEPPDAPPRPPLVAIPGTVPQSYAVKALNLVVPFGLLMIGLRFLLWCLRGVPVEAPHGGAEVPQ